MKIFVCIIRVLVPVPFGKDRLDTRSPVGDQYGIQQANILCTTAKPRHTILIKDF